MSELSEKEIELEYKDLKMMDIPDMWYDIERKLAPKKQEPQKTKKVIPIRRIASMAAAVAVVLLLVPVVGVIRNAGGGSKDAEYNESATESSDMAMPEMNGSNTLANSTAEEQSVTEGAFKDYASAEAAGVEESLKETEVIQYQVHAQIRQVTEQEEGLLITVEIFEVVEEELESKKECSAQEGDIVELFYSYSNENTYDILDFEGRMNLLVEKNENNLKILEILP